jgi:phenylalanyl-tRNA synthetase alpha chain
MEYTDTRVREHSEHYYVRLSQAATVPELETLRGEFLGKTGIIAGLMAALKDMSPEEKRRLGPEYNYFKRSAQEAFDLKHQALMGASPQQGAGKSRPLDVTSYALRMPRGSLHPITLVTQRLEDIFISMGFDVVDGPEVEIDEINFEALNIPADHPARDMQDTFWLDIPRMLLRTHTSTVQVRSMRSQQPPLAVVSLGRAYRNEATDASHDFIFSQCEGLYIDKKVSMAHLIGVLRTYLQALFQKETLQVRIRPSYFPFVEPGIEVDMTCPFCASGCSVCKQSRWIELGGAGLVHPNVLRASGINPDEYSGFAWGFGLTRLCMLLYAIDDIRLLHSGRIDFLRQF